jgi:hypothetical protein
MNPFAGLPTIFSVLGKLGLELKRQENIGIHRGADRAPGRQRTITLYYPPIFGNVF